MALTPAYLTSVASFYDMLELQPRPKHARPMQLVARGSRLIRNTVCSSSRRAAEPALVRSLSCDRLWTRRTPYRQRGHRRLARPFFRDWMHAHQCFRIGGLCID
jgi:hypothetical protein